MFTSSAIALLLAASPVPSHSRQLVLAVTPGWEETHGIVVLYERTGPRAPWRRTLDLAAASFGRAGLAWGRGLHPVGMPGPIKKEGDGRSPAGVFRLRGAAGYDADPRGLRIPYRQATENLRCVDDPASRFYNRWVLEGEVTKDWASAEEMRRRDELYRWTVWVAHNDDPPAPGAGSCIFLHVRASQDSTTSGCTAFDAEVMRRILAWLDAGAAPLLVQLPAPVLRQVARRWGLPQPDLPLRRGKPFGSLTDARPGRVSQGQTIPGTARESAKKVLTDGVAYSLEYFLKLVN